MVWTAWRPELCCRGDMIAFSRQFVQAIKLRCSATQRNSGKPLIPGRKIKRFETFGEH